MVLWVLSSLVFWSLPLQIWDPIGTCPKNTLYRKSRDAKSTRLEALAHPRNSTSNGKLDVSIPSLVLMLLSSFLLTQKQNSYTAAPF